MCKIYLPSKVWPYIVIKTHSKGYSPLQFSKMCCNLKLYWWTVQPKITWVLVLKNCLCTKKEHANVQHICIIKYHCSWDDKHWKI